MEVIPIQCPPGDTFFTADIMWPCGTTANGLSSQNRVIAASEHHVVYQDVPVGDGKEPSWIVADEVVHGFGFVPAVWCKNLDDGEPVGTHVWWHGNGQKQLAGDFRAGLREGRWTHAAPGEAMRVHSAGEGPRSGIIPADGQVDPEDAARLFDVVRHTDGRVIGTPRVVDSTRMNRDAYFRSAAENAVRAIQKCSPFDLPVAQYSEWKTMNLTFNPREMFGS